jgi:hypothetical protein
MTASESQPCSLFRSPHRKGEEDEIIDKVIGKLIELNPELVV